MESILPSEAKGNMSREDFGELLQPVFDQLMDLHNTNLQFSQSQKETTRLYDKSSDIYEHLLAFCETQLGQFRKFSSETQSEQEKEKYIKVISFYEELRDKVEAEDPEGYTYEE
jgi:hypothetical protein